MSLRDYHRLSRCGAANWLRKSPAYRPLSALTARAVVEWVKAFLLYGIGLRLPLPTAEADAVDIPDKTSISLCGDWAADTLEAFEIAKLIESDQADYTINLGDVYYVGDPEETLQNVFGVAEDSSSPSEKWPLGKRSFWLCGNHEMMARGTGYFRVILPRLGQATAWFLLKNSNWLILGLDTGYNSHGIIHRDAALPKQCLAWIECNGDLIADPSHAIILMTHHQPISSFDNKEYPAAARQLAEFIKRPVLWFWGHEHRCAAYGPWTVDPDGFTFHGRCLGHGGMPVYVNDEIERPDRPLIWADRRMQRVDGIKVGYNGYAALEFDGPQLSVKYVDVNAIVQHSETWRSSGGTPGLI